MIDLHQRGGTPPRIKLMYAKISRATLVVTGTWRSFDLLSRLENFSQVARQFVDMTRQKLFSDRSGPAADYAPPKSEITSFLVSCRQIFWGLAGFSGLSNILMLTGSFFMLQV